MTIQQLASLTPPLQLSAVKNQAYNKKQIVKKQMQLPQNKLRYIFQKNDIEYIKKLGSGGFGSVYLGNSLSEQFLPFAIKCITKKQLTKSPSLQKYLTQQIHSMASLKHPNIVKLILTFVSEQSIFLVMEYCEFGNLYSYQYGQPDKIIKMPEAVNIFMQIVKGLKCIHQENIIHRDLKCQNILLKKMSKHKEQSYICKIGDFGLAKEVGQSAKSQCGTPNFMAPEILAERAYDKCVDVWSIGVILYYMLFGDYPFKGLNLLNDIQTKCSQGYDLVRELNLQIIKKRNKSIGEKDLEVLRHFFSRIFVVNPHKRMTLAEITKHPLFKDKIFSIDSEQESTESSQSMEQHRKFNIKKVQFMQGVQKLLSSRQLLSKENNLLMRYLFTKMNLCLLSTALKELECYEDKLYRKVYSSKKDQLLDIYNQIKIQLEKMLASKVQFCINLSLNTLKVSYEKFQYFKDTYRIFLGYIFTQVHSKTVKDKQKIKIKILCCHTINRVFEDANIKYFSIYQQWLTKKNAKKKSVIDMDLFNKWIDQESQENIAKTIAAINQYFYAKK